MKVTAVWGSSGSGKTTLALALAAQFAARKQDTLVIGMDSRTPMLPVYLPNIRELSGAQSLGAVLERSIVSDGDLKDRFLRHPQCDHLYFMGLVSGEISGITYKPVQRSAIDGLLHILRQSPFQNVIFDCDSSAVYDQLTLYALETADVVVRTATPDPKGYEGIKAALAWLGNNDIFAVGRHIKVLSPVWGYTPMVDALSLFGEVDAVLPWAAQVAERQMAGRLLSHFDCPDAIRYGQAVVHLYESVVKRFGV